MEILRIEELDQKRVRVVLDDGCSFPLYKGESHKLGLREGGELTREQFLEVRQEILIKRARKRTMHLLERMDRTESQLRIKLRQGYYPEDVIEDAISYVRGYHYVDDLRYAQNFVRNHRDSRSRRMLKMQLQEKGVARETIWQALEEEYGQGDEQEQILFWIRKKNFSSASASDLREKQKMYRFLMRKGFSSNEILYALEHLT